MTHAYYTIENLKSYSKIAETYPLALITKKKACARLEKKGKIIIDTIIENRIDDFGYIVKILFANKKDLIPLKGNRDNTIIELKG